MEITLILSLGLGIGMIAFIILPIYGRIILTKQTERAFLVLDMFAFLFAPAIGYGMIFLSLSEIELLDPDTIWWVILIHILNTLAYFLFHVFRTQLSPIAKVIMPIIFSIAIGIYILQIIHFSIALIYIFIPPIGFFGIAYFALFYVLALTIKSLHLTLKDINQQILDTNSSKLIQKLIGGKYATLIQIALSPIYIWILNSILVIASEKGRGILHAFIESSDGLFSEGVCNHCQPVTEYVCTVAGFGSDNLVKPLCYGERHGNPIRVNRQIQVCNAFEELLAIQLPVVQKQLRKWYDALQIPVHTWKHSTLIANCLYLLIKPLELFCLLYVYTFHQRPEFIISKQYLPAEFVYKQKPTF